MEVLIAESCADSYHNMASAERGAAAHRFQVCLMGGCCWSTRWHVKTVLLSKEQHLNTVVLLWTGAKSCIIWKRKTKEEQFQIGARSCLKCTFFFPMQNLCVMGKEWGRALFSYQWKLLGGFFFLDIVLSLDSQYVTKWALICCDSAIPASSRNFSGLS